LPQYEGEKEITPFLEEEKFHRCEISDTARGYGGREKPGMLISKSNPPTPQLRRLQHNMRHFLNTSVDPPSAHKEAKKKSKTYNSRYSLVVTHPTTNLPIYSLIPGERTGSHIFCSLWSYVEAFVLFNYIQQKDFRSLRRIPPLSHVLGICVWESGRDL
jgi:hypothetical protein